MYNRKDTAVGKRTPHNLPVPCTAISTLMKRKAIFRKITDNTVSASGRTEHPEQGGNGILHFFIRKHDWLAIQIVDIAYRERGTQFSFGSGIFLAADHTGMEEMEFRFAHGSLEANEEPVIKIRHVIDAVFIDDEASGQGLICLS